MDDLCRDTIVADDDFYVAGIVETLVENRGPVEESDVVCALNKAPVDGTQDLLSREDPDLLQPPELSVEKELRDRSSCP